MRRITLAVVGALVLPFLATSGYAQGEPVKGTQQDLRYITNQFQEIAANYLPGTPYERTMNELVQRVEAMSEDESRYLKPLIPAMLANLQMFKDALSSVNKPRSVRYRAAQTAGGAEELPNAEYPNIQLSAYPSLALPALYDLANLLPTILDFVAHGNVVTQDWASSWVNAAPLTCVTKLDANGGPIRTPDFTMQGLRTAVQVAEAIKEGANCVLEQVLTGVGFGANAKWLTIVPTGIWLVGKAVYENMAACDNMISGAEASAAYQRLAHIHGDLASLTTKTDAAQDDLTSLKTTLAVVQTKLDEAIQLLKTPPGLRPDFPIKK